MKTRKTNFTGANRGNREGNQNLWSLLFLLFNSGLGGGGELDFSLLTSEGVNIYSKRDGDVDFKFLACPAGAKRRRTLDTQPPYVDSRPMLVAGKPKLRSYKAVFVVGDEDGSQFSDEITVNCASLV